MGLLPDHCLIASLNRGSQTLVPHGNTTLQAGDVLVVTSQKASREALERFFATGEFIRDL
ncbi:TrkA C-terminal domain-containing protein [Anaerolinea thermophila]|uniref:TrkA C-terminal domain-containing protein n=1 Tax=Anaerolinea TaxID=233189 RepID=UPI0034E988B9